MKESKNSFQQLAERYSGGGGVATLKIKDWYTKNYPADDLGEEINGVNTFEDLWNEIHKMDINDVTDIYDVIGVVDSLVRERLFYNLSKIKQVEYRYVYDKWLESDEFVGSMATGGGVGHSISDINDGEIRVFSHKIKSLLSFVGEGMDINFEPQQNEVIIEFTENAWGGIAINTWNKTEALLDGMKGKNGFDDYSINPSHNKIVLVFENGSDKIGEYSNVGSMATGGGVGKKISDVYQKTSSGGSMVGENEDIRGKRGYVVDKNYTEEGNRWYLFVTNLHGRNEMIWHGDRSNWNTRKEAQDYAIEKGVILDKIYSSGGSMATGGGMWQIKNSADKYYSLNMQSSKPVWNDSPDLGYSFAKDEAERIKNSLGNNDLQVVEYNPNWWKMSDGGGVDLKYYRWTKDRDYDSILKKGYSFEEAYDNYADLIDSIKEDYPDLENKKGFFKSNITENDIQTGIIVASDSTEAYDILKLGDKTWHGFHFIYKNGDLMEAFAVGGKMSDGGGVKEYAEGGVIQAKDAVVGGEYWYKGIHRGRPKWIEVQVVGNGSRPGTIEIKGYMFGAEILSKTLLNINEPSHIRSSVYHLSDGGDLNAEIKWKGNRPKEWKNYFDIWEELTASGKENVVRNNIDEIKKYVAITDDEIIEIARTDYRNSIKESLTRSQLFAWLVFAKYWYTKADIKKYNKATYSIGGLVGKRIRLINMTDPYPVEPGTMGTITSIDGIGQIQVNWDNGRTLAVIPGEDEYEIIEDAKHYGGGDIEGYENYIVELKKGGETRRLGILAHNQQEAVSKAKKLTGKGYSVVAINFAKGGRIQSARITELPKEPFDGMPMPKVFVTVDSKEEYLFEYYPDELNFTPEEFVGLTVDQARHLKFEKDKKFLQGDLYAGGGKPKKTKIYAVLRTSMGVLEDIEVPNTNVAEAMAEFKKVVNIHIPDDARITFQSQPYYYAEGGGLGKSIDLYNNLPGHDKEYHMTIIKTGMNFTVVSKWGRRGTRLRETLKTVFNIEDAQKIFNKLKREKLAEGYIEKGGGESVPVPAPAPVPAPVPDVPNPDFGALIIEKRTTPYKRSDIYSNKIYKVD